jgi:hypothetical protein
MIGMVEGTPEGEFQVVMAFIILEGQGAHLECRTKHKDEMMLG